jgi:hypothetical protein
VSFRSLSIRLSRCMEPYRELNIHTYFRSCSAFVTPFHTELSFKRLGVRWPLPCCHDLRARFAFRILLALL